SSADGYVRSEGCGVVVLKRLSDAESAGDTILAVIRGSAVNQDGRSNGITAPNGPAQQRVVRAALAQADLDPEDIDYIEAHGTGTPLGDPIEVQALAAVMKDRKRPLFIGSVKSNIGHAEGAAGVAGLIKTILALQDQDLPRTLHAQNLNPRIPWDDIPVRVLQKATPWPMTGRPRRAGVSSFGFSGTNAHIVIEQHRDSPQSGASEVEGAVLAISARSPARLSAMVERFAAFVGDNPGADLLDLGWSTCVGRTHFAHRQAIVYSSRATLLAGLGGAAARGAGAARALADSWQSGEDVDWTPLYPSPRRRMWVPNEPFLRRYCWRPEPSTAVVPGAGTPLVILGAVAEPSPPAGIDARFFGLRRAEASALPPGTAAAIERAWESLEHAGIPPESLAELEVGVFTGGLPERAPDDILSALRLSGPGGAVSVGVASGVAAIHLASQSLRSGDCSIALAITAVAAVVIRRRVDATGGALARLSGAALVRASRRCADPGARARTLAAARAGLSGSPVDDLVALVIALRAGLSEPVELVAGEAGQAHAAVILQPAAPARLTLPTPALTPLVLSAPSPAALQQLTTRFADALLHQPTLWPGARAAAACGRDHHLHRLAVVAEDHLAAAEKLRAAAAASHRSRRVRSEGVVFLFSGQGAQLSGMGLTLYETWPVFRQALDDCAALLAPHLDIPLLTLLAAPDELLRQTRYTQPALFCVSYALARLWASWGVTPSAAVGHSVGEIAALCVAGAVSLADALAFIAARGRLMGDLPAGGAMAVVFASEAAVTIAIGDSPVAIAANNGETNTVISGPESSVAAVLLRVQDAGFVTREITVSHAFHSPLMEPILEPLQAAAAGMTWSAPAFPVIANVTGEPHAGPPDAAYFSTHARQAVRFAPSVEQLLERGHRRFLEIGPGSVLVDMTRRLPGGRAALLQASIPRDQHEAIAIAAALGDLYTSGLPIDWERVHGGCDRRIRLPTTPFQRPRPEALPAHRPAISFVDTID
ncbi:MAG: acyl transferase domain-containing protein, partial [Myxococcota bacterium]